MGSGAGPATGRLTASLRQATHKDVDAIAAIERVAFSDPWSAASFAGLVAGPRVRMTVAEDRGLVVGYSVLLLAGPDADLANLAVDPVARGRGLGRLLLDGALRSARDARVRFVYLEVRESNARAIALYESAGFKQFGERRRYYRQPVENARVLRLDLSEH
jgi:ribosomal-protein-alanine N-acetyltransferase